jgi:hypothetical protein
MASTLSVDRISPFSKQSFVRKPRDDMFFYSIINGAFSPGGHDHFFERLEFFVFCIAFFAGMPFCAVGLGRAFIGMRLPCPSFCKF